jgi:VanZ family protein
VAISNDYGLSERIRQWIPVAVWSACIFIFSTSYFSAANTAIFFEPIIKWFLPGADPSTVDSVHFLIRKTAHFSEYLMMFTLLVRGPLHGRPLPALAICAAMAVGDEFHQSFVMSRTASIFDVGLDFSGAVFAGCVRAAFIELI